MSRRNARGKAVGHYTCPNPLHPKPVIAVMRQKDNEEKTLYGYCYSCGFLNLTLAMGQEFFMRKGVFWPKDAAGAPIPPPAGEIPECVRLNLAWSPDSKKNVDEIEVAGDPPRDPDPPRQEPVKDKAPPGDASDLAPPGHRRKPKTGKGYVLPFEVDNDD